MPHACRAGLWDHSGFLPTSVIQVVSPLSVHKIVFGKPFLLYLVIPHPVEGIVRTRPLVPLSDLAHQGLEFPQVATRLKLNIDECFPGQSGWKLMDSAGFNKKKDLTKQHNYQH